VNGGANAGGGKGIAFFNAGAGNISEKRRPEWVFSMRPILPARL